MEENKKINILGTEYEYDLTTERQDVFLYGINGYCDAYEKRIAVENERDQNNPTAVKKYDEFIKKVKRHEIIHAYFHESGLKKKLMRCKKKEGSKRNGYTVINNCLPLGY